MGFKKELTNLLMENLLNNNMKFYKLFSNPIHIYVAWVILFILFLVIGIPLLSKGHSGGEQVPLILSSYAFNWLVYGMLTISLITPFCFLGWFKKFWYISLGVGAICFYLII